MKIGYARVSTDDQNLDLQMDALNRAGCERIFTDQGVSGATIERKGLSQAIAAVGKDDVVQAGNAALPHRPVIFRRQFPPGIPGGFTRLP